MTRFWTLPPNWRNSVPYNHEFRTETLTSRAGREQRIGLRNEPRREFSFLTTCHKDQYRALARSLTEGQAEDWWVADPVTTVGVASGAPQGGSTITPLSLAPWMTPGRKVVLTTGTRHGLYTIDTVGMALSFDESFETAWPVWTKIALARRCYLKADMATAVETSTTVELTVSAEVIPGSDPIEIPEAPLVTFNGREVFLKRPNWRERISDNFIAGREIVDYGRGRIASYKMLDFVERSRRAIYLGRDRAELDAIYQFFRRQFGQQGEFYAPTWMEDIVPNQALASGQNTLRVAGTDFHAAYADDTIHKALVVILHTGQMLYRTITGMTTGGGNTTITCGANWPSNIALTDIRMVCWLPVWRFVSDTLTLEWITDEKGQAALAMKTLEDLSGE